MNGGSLWHTVGTKELKLLEGCCHSNFQVLARSKIAIFLQAWAYQAARVEAELRIYPGTLSFELRDDLNQVNG